MKKIMKLLMGFLLVANAQAAPVPEAKTLATEPKRFGDYEVHFSAFNSTFVSPEIAKVYQLQRSPRHGLVNISVLNVKKPGNGSSGHGHRGRGVHQLTFTTTDPEVPRSERRQCYLLPVRVPVQQRRDAKIHHQVPAKWHQQDRNHRVPAAVFTRIRL